MEGIERLPLVMLTICGAFGAGFFLNFSLKKLAKKPLHTELRTKVLLAMNQKLLLHSQILDLMSEGVCLVRAKDGIIVYINQRFEELFGYAEDELVGSSFNLLNAPSDQSSDDLTKKIAHDLWEVGLWKGETKNITKQGQHFWSATNISAFDHNEFGRVWVAIFSNITGQKHAEAALKTTEEQLGRLINVVRDYAIFMLDVQGQVASWNDGARNLTGFEEASILGRHFKELYIASEVSAGKPSYDLEQAQCYGRYEDEGWRIKKDGTVFWANMIITAMPASDGSITGFSCVIRDVSEKKQAQDKLQWALYTLERRVEERTAELARANEDLSHEIQERKMTQQALAAQAKELARSNADLEQFASVASHDLKAPLRTIASYLTLLDRQFGQELDSKARGYIQYAVEGAKRLGHLITHLLEYSRAGDGELQLTTLTSHDVLRKVLAFLKPEIESTGTIVTSETLPLVLGDEPLLFQVFYNLISNAIKFRRSEPRIDIRCRLEGDQCMISVEDNGIGIEATHYDRVFKVFQRLHSEDEYPGSGVGLAICKRIIERHNGKIGVSSRVGEGSTFFFSLQMADSNAINQEGELKNAV